ncbi:hypothetical protein ABBQ32_010427 [Trebouxia sp. C0010 RCD-2024]
MANTTFLAAATRKVVPNVIPLVACKTKPKVRRSTCKLCQLLYESFIGSVHRVCERYHNGVENLPTTARVQPL